MFFSSFFGVHGEGELNKVWDWLKLLGGVVKVLPLLYSQSYDTFRVLYMRGSC